MTMLRDQQKKYMDLLRAAMERMYNEVERLYQALDDAKAYQSVLEYCVRNRVYGMGEEVNRQALVLILGEENVPQHTQEEIEQQITLKQSQLEATSKIVGDMRCHIEI